jgi:hypothetical protein
MMLKSVGVVLRLSVLVVLVAAALALAGCGGGGAGDGGTAAPAAEGAQQAAGAEIAPAGTAVFVSITTEAESAQWKAADALLQRFPGRDELIRSILEDTEAAGLDWETDIKPALGPEVDIVVLPSGAAEPVVVGLTQPADAAKLEQLVQSGDQPGVLEVVDGWTVFAESQAAIDAFTAAGGGSLADSEAYREALESLPAESLVSVFVDGEKLTDLAALGAAGAEEQQAFSQLSGAFGSVGPVAFALSAQPGGVAFGGFASQEGGPQLDNFAAALPSQVPADAILYLGFANLAEPLDALLGVAGEAQPTLDQQLAQAETFLGLSLRDDLLPLFAGEGALVVAPGSPIPAISLILEVEDEQKAQRILDKLATLAGGFGGGLPKAVDIEGVSAQELVLEQFSVFFAAFDGKLVVTSARAGISGLVAAGPKLADDANFVAAREAAGMPDETTGFVYADLGEGIGLIEGYARLAGDALPPEVSANLEPLGSFLAYSAREGDRLTFSGFLAIE